MARHVLKGAAEMFTLRRALAFWAALLAITVAGRVHAQTATLKINKTGITHSVGRDPSSTRGLAMINRSDCEHNDEMTFPVSVSNVAGLTLQAWVGTNCTDLNSRTITNSTAVCWKVYETQAASAVDNGNSINVPIHVSSMIAGYTNLFGPASCSSSSAANGGASSGGSSNGDSGGNGGNDATSGSGGTGTAGSTSNSSFSINQVVEPDSKYCDISCPQGVTGATPINLFLMLVNSDGKTIAVSDSWSGSFKLVGPPAPDKISTGIGGNLLVVDFSYSTQLADTTGNGYYLYCDPAPGRDAAADAGLIDPDAGTSVGLSCGDNPPRALFKGDQDTPSQYRCGSAQKTSTSANATGLINGVPYNVAIAAYDTYENVGPLSDTSCRIPQAVTGFFKAYRDAGGKAGGGFCSFSTQRQPFNLLALLGVGSFLVLRRRRAA